MKDGAKNPDGAQSGKPPVVLLHGWMMSRRCWDEVAARLRTMFDLYIAELPGHEVRGETNGGGARVLRIAELLEHNANGDTDDTGARPPGYGANKQTDGGDAKPFRSAGLPGHNANNGSAFSRPGELVAALAAAAPRRAVWVGWSLGGVLAQAVACRYPERVAGLVCIAAAARFVACDEWPHGMAPAVFDDFAAAFARDADGAARRFLSLQTAGNGDAALLRRLRQAAARGGAHAEQAAALRFLGDSDLRGALRDCRCRADFIGGGHDRLVAARAVKQSSRLARDGRFHNIADAGHAAPVSHAGRVCEIIRQCAEHARAAT
ncbi:MAG: alpha/beta fold hydrolase [Gammaproteobacteria bacterium]|nr:alpha/beta fold hydrolase [Gammaproteobacteria bacterium]